MASYRVSVTQLALKYLRKIPDRDARRIWQRIDRLAEAPRGPGCVKLTGLNVYRARQGDYRIIYEIKDLELLVTVIKVGHRSTVYRGAGSG